MRDVVGKAFQAIGYEIGYEHGGGLQDGRKPGDVIVYNWKNRKHLLIDVAITNPLAPTNHTLLLANGPGHTARHRENKKRTKYWDLDTMTYDFWPFIIEITGAFGPSALGLCTMIANKRKMKCWKGISNQAELKDEKGLFGQDPLLTSINITVQRNNAHMILERQPAQSQPIESGIERCHKAAIRVQRWAKKRLTQMICGPLHRIFDTQQRLTTQTPNDNPSTTLGALRAGSAHRMEGPQPT